jgi:hypothetical protein
MLEVDVRRHLPVHVTWILGISLVWISLDLMSGTRLGQDSHAYWNLWQGSWDREMYTIPPGYLDAYNYSPAFAQLVWPLSALPWPAFGLLWSLAATAAFTYLLRPLGWRWVLPLLLCCAPEILSGNVFWILALVTAWAARPGARPRTGAWWSVVVLTKVTPALGPVWYAVRREWGPLAWSVAGTAAVVAASALISPELWSRWISFLLDNENSSGVVGSPILGPLAVRLPLALVLVVWGAATDRRWTLPMAMALATPVAGPAAFTMLAAVPRMRGVAAGSPVHAAEPPRRAVHET